MSMITDSFNLIANLYPRMTPGLFARLFAPDDKKMFNMWLKHENISMFLKELAGDEIIPFTQWMNAALKCNDSIDRINRACCVLDAVYGRINMRSVLKGQLISQWDRINNLAVFISKYEEGKNILLEWAISNISENQIELRKLMPVFRSIPIKEEPIKIMKTQQPSPGVRSMEQISKILGWKG